MFAVNTTLGENAVGGYVETICEYGDDTSRNVFDFDLSQYDLSGFRINAYILRENGLEFDQEKYDEIMSKIVEETTWEEKMEAQITYTALVTDSLLEE